VHHHRVAAAASAVGILLPAEAVIIVAAGLIPTSFQINSQHGIQHTIVNMMALHSSLITTAAIMMQLYMASKALTITETQQ